LFNNIKKFSGGAEKISIFFRNALSRLCAKIVVKSRKVDDKLKLYGNIKVLNQFLGDARENIYLGLAMPP